MNDDLQAPAQPTPGSGTPGRRRRWVPFVAAGAVIAVAAGATGALAATIGHRTDPTPAASTGPSVYIPYAGPGQDTAGQAGLAPGGVAAGPAGVSYAAPMPMQGGGAQRAWADSSIAYPYPGGGGFCSGAGTVQVNGQVVSATGTSQVASAAAAAAPTYGLWASVNSQGGGDAGAKISSVRSRLAAVIDALVGAGVPRSSIHSSDVNVYVNDQKNGGPNPAQPAGTTQTFVNANASLAATVSDAGILDKAVTAAANAGADNVNASTQQQGVKAPSSDAVSAAIAQATDQAKQLAAAGAKASGITLGGVHTVSVQQPVNCGYGADGARLVVAVTVAWDIK